MDKEILTEEMESTVEVDSELSDKWLTFRLDGQLYAASVLHVEGILGIQPITAVPEYPAYAKGIIDLRGTIIPVIDLRLRFQKQEVVYTEKTCIINCRVGENNIGFVVDEMDSVVSISGDAVSPPPRISADPAKQYLTGIARVSGDGEEKIVLCLDVTRILQQDEIDCLVKE